MNDLKWIIALATLLLLTTHTVEAASGPSVSSEALATASAGYASTLCNVGPSDGLEIHVLGQVPSAGTFWITPGTRVDEAIACAGGVGDSGSLRQVAIKRHGETGSHRTIDLFSYREYGDLSQNPYLSNQDVLFVPLYDKRVQIMGGVRKTGTYELLPNETAIMDVIRLAGGFTLLIDPQLPVTVLRASENAQTRSDKTPLEYNKTSFTFADLEKREGVLRNGDIVIVNSLRNKKFKFDLSGLPIPGESRDIPSSFQEVFVMGDVETPGVYSFKSHYALADYAREAGIWKSSKVKKIKLIDREGKRRPKGEPVSPGDIIYVPTKYLTFENVFQVWNTMTSTFFTGYSIYTIVDDLNNN